MVLPGPVYLLTPPTGTPVSPLPRIPMRQRGTGVTEQSQVPNFESVMAMLVGGVTAHFRSFGLVNTSVGENYPLDGVECIETGSNCLGDNHDTNYIHSPRQLLSANDAFVFVGTNCVQNGKCTYSNIGFYEGTLTSTPLSIDDRKFTGSASYYAPSPPAADADRLFAYAVARDCGYAHVGLHAGHLIARALPLASRRRPRALRCTPLEDRLFIKYRMLPIGAL